MFIVSWHTVNITDTMGVEKMKKALISCQLQQSKHLINNSITSMGKHYSRLIYCIIFHMQTTLSIIFPVMILMWGFFGSQESSLHISD